MQRNCEVTISRVQQKNGQEEYKIRFVDRGNGFDVEATMTAEQFAKAITGSIQINVPVYAVISKNE